MVKYIHIERGQILIKGVEKSMSKLEKSLGIFRRNFNMNLLRKLLDISRKNMYNSIDDWRIEKQREENEEIAKNYFSFLNFWLNEGKNRTDINTLVAEMLNNREIVDDDFFKWCWDKKHFNVKKTYTKEKINKKLNKKNRWQLKRGLGLALEHSIVHFFKDELIPSDDNLQYGDKAYDFLVLNEEKENYNSYDKVDLKISLGRPAKFQRNKSIYNIEVVLNDIQLKELFQVVAEGNGSKLKKICKGIYNSIKEVLKIRDRRVLLTEKLNIKNSDNWQLSEFKVNYI